MDEEYNWDDFDAQSEEYLNSGAYKGDQFTGNDGRMWGTTTQQQDQYELGQFDKQANEYLGSQDFYQGNPGYDSGQNYFKDINSGTQFWKNPEGGFAGYQEQGQQFQPYSAQQPNQAGINWGKIGQGGLDALGQLFKGAGGGSGGSTSQFLKGLAGVWAAQQEKKSNQQMAGAGRQNLETIRQQSTPYDVASTGAGMMTPGATTMRDAAMQQAALSNQRLQNFRADPNTDAGYKATTSQIENVLSRQAAQHGNRGNFNATAPAMLAAKAAAQMQYDKNYQADLNNWDTRSGANINPGISGGLAALGQDSMYDAQGNSPYASALGKILNTNSYENNPQIAELIAAIKSNRG